MLRKRSVDDDLTTSQVVLPIECNMADILLSKKNGVYLNSQ